MKRLYQTITALISLSLLLFLSNKAALAGPYTTSNCNGECNAEGRVCTQDPTTTPVTYGCYSTTTGCTPPCGANESCVLVGRGGAGVQCRQNGSGASSTQTKIPCTTSNDKCPDGSSCEAIAGYTGSGYCVSDQTGATITQPVSSGGTFEDRRESIFGTIGAFFDAGGGYEGKLPTFFELLYKALLPLAIIIGMILVAVAGWTLMTSQGDPQRAQEGKEQLTSAILGLLFVLLGAGILRAIISTLIQGSNPGF